MISGISRDTRNHELIADDMAQFPIQTVLFHISNNSQNQISDPKGVFY